MAQQNQIDSSGHFVYSSSQPTSLQQVKDQQMNGGQHQSQQHGQQLEHQPQHRQDLEHQPQQHTQDLEHQLQQHKQQLEHQPQQHKQQLEQQPQQHKQQLEQQQNHAQLSQQQNTELQSFEDDQKRKSTPKDDEVSQIINGLITMNISGENATGMEEQKQGMPCYISFVCGEIGKGEDYQCKVKLNFNYEQLRKSDYHKQIKEMEKQLDLKFNFPEHAEKEFILEVDSELALLPGEIKKWKDNITDTLTKIVMQNVSVGQSYTDTQNETNRFEVVTEASSSELDVQSKIILKVDKASRHLWDSFQDKNEACLFLTEPVVEICLQTKCLGYVLAGTKSDLKRIIEFWKEFLKERKLMQNELMTIYEDIYLKCPIKKNWPLSDDALQFLSDKPQALDFVYSELEKEGFLCHIDFSNKELQVCHQSSKDVHQIGEVFQKMIIQTDILEESATVSRDYLYKIFTKESDYFCILVNKKKDFRIIGTCSVQHLIVRKLRELNYEIIKDTIKIEKLQEKLIYFKEHTFADITSVETTFNVKITQCKDTSNYLEIEGQRMEVLSAKIKINDLFEAVKHGHFPLENNEQINRLESEDGRRFRSELKTKHRCSVSLIKRSELSGDIKPAEKTQPTQVFCCWTTNKNQTVQVISGDMSSDLCDVLVLPLQGVNPTMPPTWVKEEKMDRLFSNVLGEIQNKNKKCFMDPDHETFVAFLVFPPKWNDGKDQEKHKIEESIKELFHSLRDLHTRSETSQTRIIRIDLQDLKAFPLKKAVKPIIRELNEGLLLCDFSIRLVLSVVNEVDADELTTALKECVENKTIMGEFENYASGGNQRPLSRVTIQLGKIAKQMSDVLVNTTSEDLNLKNGTVSKSILDAAGDKIFKECKDEYPRGITVGQIAKTTGGKIKSCSNIYHGALQSEEENRYEVLSSFMMCCLNEATADRKKSIAFPALGTGQLEYPPEVVAKLMFDCAEKFFMKMPQSSILEVVFVLYPKDKSAVQAFLAEETARSYGIRSKMHKKQTGSTSKKKEFRYQAHKDCMLQIIEGDVSSCSTTKSGGLCIMKGDIPHSSRWQPTVNLTLDWTDTTFRDLKQKSVLKMKTSSIPLNLLVYCWSLDGTSPDVIHKGLTQIAAEKLYGAQILDVPEYFGTRPEEIVKQIISAMINKKNNSASTGLHLVTLVIKNPECFDKLVQRFEDYTAANQKSGWRSWIPDFSSFYSMFSSNEEPVPLWLSVVGGTEEDIHNTVRPLLKFAIDGIPVEVLESSSSVDKEPMHQETVSSSQQQQEVQQQHEDQQKQNGVQQKQEVEQTAKSSSEDLKPPSESEKAARDEFCILLRKVQSLKGKMDVLWKTLVASEQIVPLAILHPHPLSDKDETIIILKKAEDLTSALELLSKYDPQEMSLCLTKTHSDINPTVRNIIMEDKQLKKDFKEKTGLNIEENGLIEGNFFQVTAAFNFCVQLFHSTELKIDSSHYEAVEKLKIVDEEQLKKYIKITSLPSDKKLLTFNTLTTEVKELHSRIQALIKEEIKLAGVTADDQKIKSVVKDLQESTPEMFCAHIPEHQIIVMYGEDRNKLETAKRKIQVDLGQVKARTRANRTFSSNARTVDSGQQAEIKKLSNSVMAGLEPLVRGKLLDVMVYKGDITTLSVDAIVNAANGQLSHGAGVARAIASAAGDELVREGNTYVGEHGSIPVSGVVATTAGRLNYKKVLHAVGPEIYKYTDFTECLEVLCKTILRCLCEARKLNMSSVAIPSISSGIFGVPKPSCAQMYMRAVKSFDTVVTGGSLKEVHFVDISDDMLQLIQQEFVNEWDKRLIDDVLNRDEKFINQCLDDGDVPISPVLTRSDTRTAQHSASTTSPSYASVATGRGSGQSTSSADVGVQIIVYNKDIFSVDCQAIICWKDPDFTVGDHPIAQKIFYEAGEKYKKQLNDFKKKHLSHFCGGLVFVTDCGNKHRPLVIHGVIKRYGPSVTEFKNIIPKIVSEVHQKNLSSVVIPVFRCLTSDSVKIFTETLCQAVKVFSKKNPHSTLKQIHVVDIDQKVVDHVLEIVKKSGVNGDMSRNSGSNADTSRNSGVRGDTSTWELDRFKEPLSQSSPYQFHSVEGATADDNCTICMETMTDPVKLNKCSHMFCKKCIENQFKNYKPVCPNCGTLYGVLTGNMPTGGKMNVSYLKYHLSGYEKFNCICIEYSFQRGRQMKDHPNEGERYTGITRTAYLPDSPEGRTVLAMLRVAWDRRLTFTIGRSVTTGQEGVITWNDIHHKTNILGGPNKFGYPDPGYLARVTAELADKGITEESIKDPKYKNPTGSFY